MKPSAVLWRDVTTLEGQWLEKEEAILHGKVTYADVYTTVGEIIYSDKDFVLVAATSDGSGGYNDISLIPRGVIIKIINEAKIPKT